MFWRNKEGELIRKSRHYGRLQLNQGEHVDIVRPFISAVGHNSVGGLVASNLQGMISARDGVSLYIGSPYHPQLHEIPVDDSEKTQILDDSSGEVTHRWPYFYFRKGLVIQSLRGDISLTVLDPDVEIQALNDSGAPVVSGRNRVPSAALRSIYVFSGRGRLEVSY